MRAEEIIVVSRGGTCRRLPVPHSWRRQWWCGRSNMSDCKVTQGHLSRCALGSATYWCSKVERVMTALKLEGHDRQYIIWAWYNS